MIEKYGGLTRVKLLSWNDPNVEWFRLEDLRYSNWGIAHIKSGYPEIEKLWKSLIEVTQKFEECAKKYVVELKKRALENLRLPPWDGSKSVPVRCVHHNVLWWIDQNITYKLRGGIVSSEIYIEGDEIRVPSALLAKCDDKNLLPTIKEAIESLALDENLLELQKRLEEIENDADRKRREFGKRLGELISKIEDADKILKGKCEDKACKSKMNAWNLFLRKYYA